MAGRCGQSRPRRLRVPEGAEVIHGTLSRREREVMHMLAYGRAPKEVAHALGISVKTVYVYRKRLMAKLGVTRDAELTALEMRMGLIE